MSKIKRETPNYLLIGIFLFLGCLAITLSVIVSDKLLYKLKGGYPIFVTFSNIDGLAVGSKVNIGSGKAIGQVDKIEVQGATLIVTLLIEKRYKINSDANFQIFSTSLVGGKYIAVENFTGDAPHIPSGTIRKGIEPFSINQIFSVLGSFISSDNTNGSAGIDISGIFGSINQITEHINTLIQDNQTNINISIKNLADASARINHLTTDLDRKLSMISDKEFKTMVVDLQNGLHNLNTLIEDINSPNAPLSVLKDPAVNNSIRTIITNLEVTTERVKAKPSLLLRS